MHFVIESVRVFDGEKALGLCDVEVNDGTVVALGSDVDPQADRVDGHGATLLPGLIDTHTHSDLEALRQALVFGVTTELDLFSFPETMKEVRREAAIRTDVADVRSASVGMTAPGGHPTQLRGNQNDPDLPTVGRPEDAARFVDERIAEGADYIKVLIETGKTLGKDVPVVDIRVVEAAVEAAHARGKLVIAHALTIEATRQALTAGVDGFAHLFVDGPHTPELVAEIAAAGVFFIPTLSTLASLTSQHLGAALADDPRVAGKLPPAWDENLRGDFNTYRTGDFNAAVASVDALRQAGVPVLAGTDASHLGAPGMAHGVSLHGELKLLVRAGFAPQDALRAATSLAADTFGLNDRGRIVPGARADLLLVDGDPLTSIDDTLNVKAVWRGGVRVTR
ncbi:imidazolonepropionase [Streptomyces sulfonofaciens]|uniref:Imidazolonepropionase n=1 Tax=Streptomyces sulfonofaciens TaxID=68272 RepID=A0A919L9B5_9ACTN|nr:amidohydrolase family protein [Streptomyces sulfonofaciens]GHH88723.1 imidazolonepropionase [Streptomyces sulfonofaciens]